MYRKLISILGKTSASRGFTLVEMLVVAPIVIIIIGVFVGAVVTLTGDVLVARDGNVAEYNLQESLNRIKQDVSISDGFLSTNNIDIQTPQGYDNAVQSFKNANSDPSIGPILILNIKATDKNPLRPDRNIIYAKDQPNPCGTNQNQNTPVMYNVVYFVKNKSLWRRVMLPSGYTTIGCGTPWQQPSCDPSASGAFCKTKDAKLLDNIQEGNFTIGYYARPDSTSALSGANDTNQSDSARQAILQTANTIEVNIRTDSKTAGRDIIRSDKVRAVTPSGNSKSLIITSQPSNIPNLTAGNNANFTINTSRSGAAIQWQQSTDKGSSWVNLTNGGNISGATSTSLLITSAANTMDGYLYRAVVTSGSDRAVSNSARLGVNLDSWTDLSFTTYSGRTWANYNDSTGTYSTAAYRKTTSGVVVLKGLIKTINTPVLGDVIATLPTSYRPSKRLIFSIGTSPNASARIDVLANGDITYMTGSASWLSLEGIHFIPDNGRYTATPANALENGWTNFGASHTTASYVVDSLNRVHTAGLISSGATTDNTRIFNMPSSLLPSNYMHIPQIVSSSAFGGMGVSPSSPAGLLVKPSQGSASSYLTTNSMYYPSGVNGISCTGTSSGWNNLTLQNSWVNYGGNYTTAQYIKGSDNLISLRGLIKSGLTTDETVIATLPTGCRPTKRVLYTAYSNNNYARLDINIAGDIIFKTGSSTWLSLDGVTFYAG